MNLYFYYYAIIPQIKSNSANVPKSNEYIKYNKVDGDDYYSVEFTEAGKKKYEDFILKNNEESTVVSWELEKVVDEILSSKWYCKIDEKGFVKLWGVFDGESVAIKHEHLIQWRFERIYYNLKNQIHEHFFLNLEEGLPIFSKEELDQKEVYKHLYHEYIKERDDMISIHVSYIHKLKNETLKLLNNLFPWVWLLYVPHFYSTLSRYKHSLENFIWTQECLEIQFQNALNIEIKEDRRNPVLKLWISKLSDIQNSIKFGLQVLALIFVILFNLNPNISNNLFLFVYWIVTFLIAAYVSGWITKKEIKSLLEAIN